MSGEEELRESIARLERRIEALEARLVSKDVERQALSLPEEDDGGLRAGRSTSAIALIGRALIILGGAYLLRAITQETLLPELVGVGLAFVYALFWIWKRTLHYAATGVFIALAAAWESCVRFHLIDVRVAAAIIAAVAVGVLLLIHDRWLAWFTACGAGAALIALAAGAHAIAPSAVAIVPVFIAAFWNGAPYLAFAPGITLDLMLIVLAGMTAIGKATDARIVAAAIALFAMAATFTAYARKRSTLTTFDGAQLVAVILIALAGTVVLLAPFTVARVSAGVFVLALAAAAYMLRHDAFTVAAVILALFGSALAMQLELAAIAWGIASIALAYFAMRRQAAVYASASFALSGLLLFALGALFVPASPSLFAPSVVAVIAFVAISLAATIARPAQLVLIALAAFAALAMIVALLAPFAGPSPSRIAALRTILLAATALLAGRFAPTRALTNPILILGGLKLLAEDFRVGSPATLFVSLVVYGGALALRSYFLNERISPTKALT